ncbi:MAG TPA: TIGR03086 family metal-binding protein [Streptosporangiaceae bacterium]|nr:TIGR03086 family metal-binding protein [Streptosporangiaceae bacterium]
MSAVFASAQPLRQLAQAIEVTGQVVAGIADDQWHSPTPCSEWDVADVTRHLVDGNYAFAAIVTGQPRESAARAPGSAAGLPAAYRAAGAALTEAFGQPGSLERIVAMPIGEVPGIAALHLRVTELLTHGWDLATATGQDVEFPGDLAAAELAFTRAQLGNVPPGRFPFAPPRQVAEDAPAIEQLVACLGRDVGA